jgi:hypothetical protein
LNILANLHLLYVINNNSCTSKIQLLDLNQVTFNGFFQWHYLLEVFHTLHSFINQITYWQWCVRIIVWTANLLWKQKIKYLNISNFIFCSFYWIFNYRTWCTSKPPCNKSRHNLKGAHILCMARKKLLLTTWDKDPSLYLAKLPFFSLSKLCAFFVVFNYLLLLIYSARERKKLRCYNPFPKKKWVVIVVTWAFGSGGSERERERGKGQTPSFNEP